MITIYNLTLATAPLRHHFMHDHITLDGMITVGLTKLVQGTRCFDLRYPCLRDRKRVKYLPASLVFHRRVQLACESQLVLSHSTCKETRNIILEHIERRHVTRFLFWISHHVKPLPPVLPPTPAPDPSTLFDLISVPSRRIVARLH